VKRILIIDDHPIVLRGCRRILEDAGAVEVLEATTLAAGYRLYLKHRPDLVVVDLAMQGEGLGGLDLIRRMRLHGSGAPILVLSMHRDAIIVSRALEAGASGYLQKDSAPEDLLEALRVIGQGRPYLNHEMAMQVALLGVRDRSRILADLTPRELQVLALLAEGKSYAQIADDLEVSYKTTANLCSQLKVKLGARNLPELIRAAIDYLASSRGWAKPGPEKANRSR
jgi:DNA-binding NarL/FixJ family response regulator